MKILDPNKTARLLAEITLAIKDLKEHECENSGFNWLNDINHLIDEIEERDNPVKEDCYCGRSNMDFSKASGMKIYHSKDMCGINPVKKLEVKSEEKKERKYCEASCDCKICHDESHYGMPLCDYCQNEGWKKEDKPITLPKNWGKIQVEPSKRIDYCQACDAEHGYECPLDKENLRQNIENQKLQDSNNRAYAKGQKEGKKQGMLLHAEKAIEIGRKQGRKEVIEGMKKKVQKIHNVNTNNSGRFDACHEMLTYLNSLK